MFIAPVSTLLNPAVRGITDWKNPASTRPGGSSAPRVPGLAHSAAVTNTVPPTSRIAVISRVSLVWTLHRPGRR